MSDYTTDLKENPDEFDRVTLAYKNMEDEDGQQHHSSSDRDGDNILLRNPSADVVAALKGVCFIAQHIKDADKDNEVYFFSLFL